MCCRHPGILSRSVYCQMLAAACSLVALACTQFAVASVEVYDADFETGTIPVEFSGGGNLVDTHEMDTYGFGDYCIQGDSTHTILTVTNLPAHDTLSLAFVVTMLSSWDGTGYDEGGNPFSTPDYWAVTVDGTTIFDETFDNHSAEEFDQSFVPPDGCVLARFAVSDYWNAFYSTYDMSYVDAFSGIPHSADTVTVEWFAHGAGYEGMANESWLLDNVSISVVPEPATAVLAMIGTLFAFRRR